VHLSKALSDWQLELRSTARPVAVEFELKNYLLLYCIYLDTPDNVVKALLRDHLREAGLRFGDSTVADLLAPGSIINVAICATAQREMFASINDNITRACSLIADGLSDSKDDVETFRIRLILSRIGFCKTPSFTYSWNDVMESNRSYCSPESVIQLMERVNVVTRYGRYKCKISRDLSTLIGAFAHSALLDGYLLLACNLLRTLSYLGQESDWLLSAARAYLLASRDIEVSLRQLISAVSTASASMGDEMDLAICVAWTLAELPPNRCRLISDVESGVDLKGERA
jgi:hypothetical protein